MLIVPPSDLYQSDFSGLKGKLKVVTIDGQQQLANLTRERTLPFEPHQDQVVKAMVNGEKLYFGNLEELAYAQLARFYLLDEGRLNLFIDYDRFVPQISIPLRPFDVSVVITKLCNLRCLHCYNDSGQRDPVELTFEEKTNLVDYLGRWGVKRLTLTGGEPTLDPAFADILKIAEKYHMRVKVSTNGWHLPSYLLEAIHKGIVVQVNISLDGANANTHDAFRQKPGSFERVLRSLKSLRSANQLNIVLNASIHQGSLTQMEAITQLALAQGVNVISFKPVTSTGRTYVDSEKFLLTSSQLSTFQAERNQLRNKYNHQIEIDGKLITDEVPHDLLETIYCNAAVRAMMIDADGRMLPCESVSFVNEAPNYRQISPMQAWLEAPLFHWFRDLRGDGKGTCGSLGCPGCKAKSALKSFH